ncbi:Bloc-1-related complex subunit 7 [Plakobranchus ocellatus]|uniref:BLOC-1-related complex subunit 7 n=1 Tax=Plakobranchus ocellatus TaxID=259542 RepID=A0AAV4AIC2_9GAST|nr:Bloc-1-related complex subunit 7 [Plakobranchus ocellatus]
MASNKGVANWNQETKARLNDKITSNVNDVGSLLRQIIRGSKSPDFLAQAAKNFASQESYIHNSHETMRKMDLIRSQLEFQITTQLGGCKKRLNSIVLVNGGL